MLTIKDILAALCAADSTKQFRSSSDVVVCGVIVWTSVFKGIVVPIGYQSGDGIFIRLVSMLQLCPFLLLIDAEVSPVRRLHLIQFPTKVLPRRIRRVPAMHIAPLGNRQLEWVNEEMLVLEVLFLSGLVKI